MRSSNKSPAGKATGLRPNGERKLPAALTITHLAMADNMSVSVILAIAVAVVVTTTLRSRRR